MFTKSNLTYIDGRTSILRGVLDKACTIIQKSIPSLNDFLEEVYVGYDGENDSYEAFHDGERIVINVYAFLPKLVKKNPSQTMVHDFVTVVTHELAHALMPNAGHGPGWRAYENFGELNFVATRNEQAWSKDPGTY